MEQLAEVNVLCCQSEDSAMFQVFRWKIHLKHPNALLFGCVHPWIHGSQKSTATWRCCKSSLRLCHGKDQKLPFEVMVSPLLGAASGRNRYPLTFVTLFGKSRLDENSVEAFFCCNAFSMHVNALKSISNAFWNIGNAFQRKRNALQIHIKNHFQNVVMRWQTLTTRLMKPPRAVWNHSRNLCH